MSEGPGHAANALLPISTDSIAEARRCVQGVTVSSFRATPDALAPGNSTTTVSWKAKLPAGCPGLTLQLNGATVASEGSRTFTQFDSKTYRLSARAVFAGAVLRQVTVTYDTSQCIQSTWTETQVDALLGRYIETFIASDTNLSLRRDPQVSLTSRGVEVSIRINRAINNFPDLKLDLDFVLNLSVHEGKPVVAYTSFAVDTDWPWWVTGLSAGITKIVEEVIDEKIEGRLKPGLIQAIRQKLVETAALFPDYQLHSIVMRTDEVSVQVCPTS
jgi:hypothetical protein